MSKENYSLRLLGSPVNLSYRCKKKDKSHIRNRPRSALQNSCFAPDNQERSKRPFSADTKEPRQFSRGSYNSFSADQSFYPTYDGKSIESALTIRVLAPTTELLENKQNCCRNASKPIDICSNSDYGSEDTYISLGTKIKVKAQQTPKNKPASNKSNFLKYRNCSKRVNKKTMEENKNEDYNGKDSYGMEVKITGRQSPSKNQGLIYERPLSPSIRRSSYEAYFSSLEETKRIANENFTTKLSSGTSKIETDVANALDAYSRRMNTTKQQLSLVEEESSQDLDSVHSLNLPSLTYENIENCAGDSKRETETDNFTGRNTYTVNKEEQQRDINDLRTYNSFYDDFRALTDSRSKEKNKFSSSGINTDTPSKDSGYNDIGSNEGKRCTSNNSIQSSSSVVTCKANNNIKDSKNNETPLMKAKSDNTYNTFPLDKSHWTEPTNHSRLLYKDFFLKKEGGTAMPPQNSPRTGSLPNVSRSPNHLSEAMNNNEENIDYPLYLKNSTTKAYTSKVIEDYKKELEAINNLHELTLKDIKTDSISPTPLNIDKMFEVNSIKFDSTSSSEHSVDKKVKENNKKGKNSVESTKHDVSHISTKELIQNYFKVKEEYSREFPNKNSKNMERKSNTSSNAYKTTELNNKTPRVTAKSPVPVSVTNATFRNSQATKPPSSARLENVQHDKDIESWVSLTSPSPNLLDVEIEEIREVACTNEVPCTVEQIQHKDETTTEIKFNTTFEPNTSEEKLPQKCRELSNNSTVFDIYSMLKEIESFGDNPVTNVQVDIKSTGDSAEINETEEGRFTSTQKDNFLEIFEFLEKVEQSANDALSVVTTTKPQTIPKLEALLKLPQTELAQQLVTASLQLEERSCCIALLQESLTNHKEQMINKVSNLEKQSLRNIAKVKQECEATIKRHQSFIDQLINDKKTLNHRIEQLVDERRTLEERWKRSAQALEERYKLELRNQHDKMAAAQQELTVKGLESELREMAERQQKDVADLKMHHAEQVGRMQSKHAAELEQLRRSLEQEKEEALIKERHLASARLEKQILDLEVSYQEQRTRLVAEMRAENERAASELSQKELTMKRDIEAWREEQEKLIAEKKSKMEQEIKKEQEKIQETLKQREKELEAQFEQYKKSFEAEQQVLLKKKVTEIAAQHKQERDREIEKAIEMMESEAQAGRKELQDALRRNKEQYETELRELAETEQATLRRYQEAHARIRLTEDKCAEMETTINQLKTRNKLLNEKISQLESQGQEVKARCEESWRHTVEGLKKEMEELKKTHEEQMHQLYAKVKVAVARKDSAIQALTRESAKYQEKIAVLEQKLQQQRKDFLKHK